MVRVGFDDIAAAVLQAVRPARATLLATFQKQPITLPGLMDALLPHILDTSGDVPVSPHFATEADTQKYVKFLFQRADEAGNDAIAIAPFFAMLDAADARLRVSRSRTIVQWTYTRDSSSAVAVQWPLPLAADSSASESPGQAHLGLHRPRAAARVVIAHEAASETFQMLSYLRACSLEPTAAASDGAAAGGAPAVADLTTQAATPYLWVGIGGDASLSAGVVFTSAGADRPKGSVPVGSPEPCRYAVSKRLAVAGLRGQPLAVEILTPPAPSVPREAKNPTAPTPERTPSTYAALSTSVNKVHLIRCDAFELASAEQSAVALQPLASVSTRSQLLVLRAHRVPSVEIPRPGFTPAVQSLLMGGSVLGELVLLELVAAPRPMDQSARSMAAPGSAAALATPVYALRTCVLAGMHSGPVADVVFLPHVNASPIPGGRQPIRHMHVVTAGATDGKLCLVVLHRALDETDGVTARWSVQNLRSVSAHPGGVTSIALAEARLVLVSAGNDNAVRFWPASLSREAETVADDSDPTTPYGFCAVAFAENCDEVLALDIKGSVHVWDARTRFKMATVAPGIPDRLVRTTNWTSLAVLPDTRMATLTGSSATVMEPRHVTDASVIKNSDEFPIQAIHWAPATPTCPATIVTGAQSNVKVWNPADGDLTSAFDSATPGPISAIRADLVRSTIICGLSTGDVVLLSLHAGMVTRRFRPHVMRVLFVRVSECGGVLSGATDGQIRWAEGGVSVSRGPSQAPSPTSSPSKVPPATQARRVGGNQQHEVVAAIIIHDATTDSIAAVDDDSEGRVGVLRAHSHRLDVYELPSEEGEVVTCALSIDLTPSLKNASAPSNAFCFVATLALIAVADEGDVSLLEVDGPRARRRATWSTQVASATTLAFLPTQSTLLVVDAENQAWLEAVGPAIAYRGPDSDAPVPTTLTNFSLSQAMTALHVATDARALIAAYPSREAVVFSDTGAVCGRLDMTASSAAEWHVGGAPNASRLAGQDAAAGEGAFRHHPANGSDKPSGLARFRAKLDRAPPGIHASSPSDASTLEPRRHKVHRPARAATIDNAAKLAGHEPAPELPAIQSVSERSGRTTVERVTGPTAWSVDYPEDLVEAVRQEDKSNRVIAGVPELHSRVRRLRPSAKVLAEDRRQRERTVAMYERQRESMHAATPPPRLPKNGRGGMSSPRPVGDDADDGFAEHSRLPSQLPATSIPAMHRTPLPSHGQSPRLRPKATHRLQALLAGQLSDYL